MFSTLGVKSLRPAQRVSSADLLSAARGPPCLCLSGIEQTKQQRSHTHCRQSTLPDISGVVGLLSVVVLGETSETGLASVFLKVRIMEVSISRNQRKRCRTQGAVALAARKYHGILFSFLWAGTG